MENYILDIILLIPLAWGLVRGLYKGLTMSVGSLIGLILGIYLASIYSADLAKIVQTQFVLSDNVAHAISYFVIFAGVALVTFFIAKLLDKFFKLVMLSWLNRLLGALFGVFKYALILSVMLNLFQVINKHVSIVPDSTRESSILYEPLIKMVPTLLPYVKFYVNGESE